MEINPSSPTNLSPDPNPNHPAVDDRKLASVNDANLELNKLQLDQPNDSDSDDEFTFMCVISGDDDDGDDDSGTPESDKSGKTVTRPVVFPLFDQSLLSNDGGAGGGDRRLTSHVPVNKVFIEETPSPSSSSSSTTICSSISKEEEEPAEIKIKSNSTGFSKLWRFRNEMNRSNSDGRDAYVFLQSPNNKGKTSLLNDVVGGGSSEKVVKKQNDVVEGKGKKKVKKSTGSAHEVYLKQKGGRTEEERRRSYLPYRPGLMGFFTNVNGGLSKNVHPF